MMRAAILDVCLAEKGDAVGANEGMPAFTFPHDALQHILFALKSDTSVRIRRLAIQILQTVMARSCGHLTVNCSHAQLCPLLVWAVLLQF